MYDVFTNPRVDSQDRTNPNEVDSNVKEVAEHIAHTSQALRGLDWGLPPFFHSYQSFCVEKSCVLVQTIAIWQIRVIRRWRLDDTRLKGIHVRWHGGKSEFSELPNRGILYVHGNEARTTIASKYTDWYKNMKFVRRAQIARRDAHFFNRVHSFLTRQVCFFLQFLSSFA